MPAFFKSDVLNDTRKAYTMHAAGCFGLIFLILLVDSLLYFNDFAVVALKKKKRYWCVCLSECAPHNDTKTVKCKSHQQCPSMFLFSKHPPTPHSPTARFVIKKKNSILVVN